MIIQCLRSVLHFFSFGTPVGVKPQRQHFRIFQNLSPESIPEDKREKKMKEKQPFSFKPSLADISLSTFMSSCDKKTRLNFHSFTPKNVTFGYESCMECSVKRNGMDKWGVKGECNKLSVKNSSGSIILRDMVAS